MQPDKLMMLYQMTQGFNQGPNQKHDEPVIVNSPHYRYMQQQLLQNPVVQQTMSMMMNNMIPTGINQTLGVSGQNTHRDDSVNHNNQGQTKLKYVGI